MANSETSASSQTADLVLEALADLLGRYEHAGLYGLRGIEKDELTDAEMGEKNQLFDKVQSSLILSIYNHTNSFLYSLNLHHDWRKQTEAESQLTCEHLSKLNQTLKETSECIHLVSGEFDGCADLIKALELDKWEDKLDSYFDSFLKTLNILIQPTISYDSNIGAVRKHVIQLSKSTIPLVKLARILRNIITKRNPKRLPFTLDTELNSKTLFQLYHNAEQNCENF
ncbi:hypothetical protein PSHT_05571 [Puccinia striiformis]|uniref:Uncharacterized protein n=3 Tax=Puccinia striiformis TaxID=27350 RepID=A0A0L0V446_9BASI|nr:hypothetical protein PSTG_12862 [Puccinia striiformis f. sp. tritici PST-78]POW09966.1 hypothetical protein PSTT_06456 [Puccinia striiformis]POW18733.1 hypothetical protein PSHT_05571 [Puccinia striiformis]